MTASWFYYLGSERKITSLLPKFNTIDQEAFKRRRWQFLGRRHTDEANEDKCGDMRVEV